MTNKERYKEAFSTLQTSGSKSLEVENMMKLKRKHKINIAAAVAAGCIVLGGSVSAYAADVGGIQTKLSMWIHGSEVEVDVTDNEDGSYSYTYNENGKEIERSGGGVAIEDDGTERELSAQEILEECSGNPDVDTDEEGNVWVYYYDQKIDITNLFDEDNVCRIVLTHEDEKLYVKITADKDGSYPCECTSILTDEEQELYTKVQ